MGARLLASMRWWSSLSVLLALFLLLSTTPAAARTRFPGPFFYRFEDTAGPVMGPPGEDWRRVDDLLQIPTGGGRSLWVATQLPETDALDPTLHLPRIYLTFEAWVDGESIGDDHHRDAGGRAWHMIPLLPHHDGGWLTLHVSSDFSKTGIRGPLHVGSRAEHFRAIVVEDAPRTATVMLLLAVGLAALLFAVRRERSAFLGFAGWAVCVAMWTMFYTNIRELLLPEPRVWVVGWGISLAWVVPSFLLFFNASFRRDERWLTWGQHLATGSAVFATVILLSRAPSYIANPVLFSVRVLVGVVFVAVVLVLVRRLRAGDREAAILAFGMVVYSVVGLRDVLVAFGTIQSFELVSPWGMLVFLIAGAVVLQRRLLALRARADRDAVLVSVNARERELMLRDMHDGLGRITTSISLLTEVARRQPGEDGPLASISSLAREGSEEIRIFMRGLDDDERDWVALEAQLREQAAHVVDAMGGHYELDASVAADAPPPSPYLYVNLLRILHEGLTNALKYADAPTIHVKLDVTRDRARLSVHNDNVRADTTAGHGIGLGAGLTNMRRRIEELGGTLALTLRAREQTATLELEVPSCLHNGASRLPP